MTANLEYPSWPVGLSDQTLLPFAMWRVLDVVDGRQHVSKLAATLGMPEPQIKQVVHTVEQHLERAAQRERPINEEGLQLLTQCLNAVVGPMGRMMMDDALDDVGEQATLTRLIGALNAELNDTNRQAFLRQLRMRGIA
ncbi:hypothetical protein [Deinococcus sonorensis]|uniref:DUF8082 domain-containing protein n=2 Tax=Deinococcus sonorensis TaxID=309891 RepID=A0AAU7U7H4_9DEIO